MTLDTINFSTTAKPKRLAGALKVWEKPYILRAIEVHEIDEGDGLVRLVLSAPGEQATEGEEKSWPGL